MLNEPLAMYLAGDDGTQVCTYEPFKYPRASTHVIPTFSSRDILPPAVCMPKTVERLQRLLPLLPLALRKAI